MTEQTFVIDDEKVKKMMANRDEWYTKSKLYWKDVPSTVDGMLGGFGNLTFSDLQNSAVFLGKMLSNTNKKRALDCGAGIGRITKGLLLNIFENVEMLDTCKGHLDQAKEYIGEPLFERVTEQHCCGLEDFYPPSEHYDLVWLQWVIIYLSDHDFITLLQRLQKSLAPGGLIIIKDNISCDSDCIPDYDDSSVTRSHRVLQEIISKAGLELVHTQEELNFPKELYPLRYYVLK